MKSTKTLFLSFLTLLYVSVFGQTNDPVKWSFSVNKISDTEAELIFKASIQKDWHMYSMNQPTMDGGMPLSFEFEKNKNYVLTGGTTEQPKPHEEFDKGFEVNVRIFENAATFKQKIKILSSESFSVKGSLSGQACVDVCVLLNKDFEFKIEGTGGAAVQTNTASAVKDSDTTVKTNTDTVQNSSAAIDDSDFNDDCGSLEGTDMGKKSLWQIFIEGLVGGFLALLTPCVFSMLPLTVSFFIKQSKDRKSGVKNASIYSISIIAIFCLLGVIITKAFGPDALNSMASAMWSNLLFFFIFIVFAASFLGAFEITLPSSWINKADKAADRGGLIGIFFMAFTLVLVSFSCTAPVIGGLLALVAQGGNNLGALVGMFGFSFALSLPFTLFAIFPAYLNSLPKSGGWLNSVKVSLGFLELALALKFLSNVDLAYHWGILPREPFVAIWIVLFGTWGLYLLGAIRFSHDSKLESLSVPRFLYAVIVLSFTVYLIPGLWGAPLKLISGFPPPDFYKEWSQGEENHCPHNLSCFHDYEEGMAYARNHGKPVMIDFTGWSCVNCRKMEDNVWGDPEILKYLREDYVLISLYVDDKTTLPENQQTISSITGNKIKTLGAKWSEMQTAVYNTNSQPYYVLIDNKGKKLARPRGGYNPDISIFKQYLEEGLCRYKKRAENN